MQSTVRRNRVTTLIVAGFTTLGFAAAAVAQTPAPAAPPAAQAKHGAGLKAGARHEDGMAKLAKELNLTDAQKAQVKTIREAARTQTKALKGNTTLTPDQKKEQLKSIRKDTAKKLAAVLTPEQKAKWTKIRAEQKAARAKMAGGTMAASAASAPAKKP